MTKNILAFLLALILLRSSVLAIPTLESDTILSKQQIENIYVLTKVWGFIKYHHPVVANGSINFDKSLLSLIEPLSAAPSKEKRNELLLGWINSLGNENEYELTTAIPDEKNIHVKANLGWINDKNIFNEAVIAKLNSIYLHRNQGSNAYIKLTPLGNPDFSGEEKYMEMEADDGGMRMLALLRYWNIIEYFFPSRYLIKENWDDVLKEFIPLLAASKTMLDYKLNCLKLINRIHDTHATIANDKDIDNYYGEKYTMTRARMIDGKLIVTAFIDMEKAKDDVISLGDEILTIENKTIAVWRQEREPFLCASNESVANLNFTRNLLRGNGEAISITYNHNGEIKSGSLKLYLIEAMALAVKKISGQPSSKFINDSVGYITLATIKKSDLPIIFETFKNTKGIIIDIRNYPAEFVAYLLGNYIKPSSSPFAKISVANINNPGLFTFHTILSTGSKNKNYYKGKVVVLVDERSMSQAEFTTMAIMSAPNAIVIGSQTAGADGDVSAIPFPGGFNSWISGLGVFYPDGKETQRIGIVPDIEVRPTQVGAKKGIDELFESAMKYIIK